MLSLISTIAGATGLSENLVKIGGAILIAAAVASAVMIYNGNLRDQGAAEITRKLQDDDNKTLTEKAKRDAEISNEGDDDLLNRFDDDSVQPKP